MGKRKSFLGRLFGWLLGIVLTFVVLIAGVVIFVNKKYGINLFETYKQVKIMAKAVDEDKLFTNKFNADDMASASVTVNAKIDGLITETEDGYKISSEGLTEHSNLTAELMISDKQMGAIVNNLLTTNGNSLGVDFAGEKATAEIVQIKFENIDELGNADLNIVIKVDISFMQEKLNQFPMSMFKKYVPKMLYISSTTTITKVEGKMNYSVASKTLKINNLDGQQTTEILKALNIVAPIGSADELNLTVGQQFADVLIGNSENEGFAHSLKDLGVADYTFKSVDGVGYFVLQP